MKKIMIIGSGGAGKSTLSKKLGQKLNIEVFHLDRFFWKPNWEQITDNELAEIQKELTKKEQWVIDGNYSNNIDIRLNEADTIIFIDLKNYLCVWRVFKRSILNYNKQRSDIGEGCLDKIDFAFLKWVWNYPKRSRPKIIEKLNKLEKLKKIYVLKSSFEVKKFIEDIV